MKKQSKGKLGINKFEVAKIKKPSTIVGGNDSDSKCSRTGRTDPTITQQG